MGADMQAADLGTTYVFGNLMWLLTDFATVGFEYGFARRTEKDRSRLDNHRVGIVFQVF